MSGRPCGAEPAFQRFDDSSEIVTVDGLRRDGSQRFAGVEGDGEADDGEQREVRATVPDGGAGGRRKPQVAGHAQGEVALVELVEVFVDAARVDAVLLSEDGATGPGEAELVAQEPPDGLPREGGEVRGDIVVPAPGDDLVDARDQRQARQEVATWSGVRPLQPAASRRATSPLSIRPAPYRFSAPRSVSR